MALTDYERKFLGALNVNNGRSDFEIFKVKVSSPVNDTLYFVKDKVDGGEHPLFSAEDANVYRQALRKLKPLDLITWTNNGGVKSSIKQSMVAVSNSTQVDLDAISRVGNFSEDVIDYSGMTGVNAEFTTETTEIKVCDIDCEVTYSKGYMTISKFLYNMGAGKDGVVQPSRIGHTLIKSGSGFPKVGQSVWQMDDLNRDTMIAKAIKSLPVPASSILGALPVYVDNSFSSSAPFVKGTRRAFMFFPSNSSTSPGSGIYNGFMVAFYIAGEGADILSLQTAWCEDGYRWRPNPEVRTLPTFDTIVNGVIGTSSSIRQSRAYPINGDPLFTTSIEGNLVLDNFDTTLEFDGQIAVSVSEYSLEVDKLYGSIDLQTYASYLNTGMGVLPPLSTERVSEIIKSWQRVTSGFHFVIKEESASGYSVKKSSLYQEYGKRREKACKTNNFLELAYNQEYTYKQVENKLSNLVKRDAWMWDVKDTPVGGKDSGDISVGTVTLTKVNELQFSALVSGNTASTTYAMTEDGVSAFMDAHLGMKIVNSEILVSVVGNDLEGYNLSDFSDQLTQGVSSKPYAMSNVGYIAGYAITLSELEESGASYDTKLRFLMSQVTDFSQFQSKLVAIVKSFNSTTVFDHYIKNPNNA